MDSKIVRDTDVYQISNSLGDSLGHLCTLVSQNKTCELIWPGNGFTDLYVLLFNTFRNTHSQTIKSIQVNLIENEDVLITMHELDNHPLIQISAVSVHRTNVEETKSDTNNTKNTRTNNTHTIHTHTNEYKHVNIFDYDNLFDSDYDPFSSPRPLTPQPIIQNTYNYNRDDTATATTTTTTAIPDPYEEELDYSEDPIEEDSIDEKEDLINEEKEELIDVDDDPFDDSFDTFIESPRRSRSMSPPPKLDESESNQKLKENKNKNKNKNINMNKIVRRNEQSNSRGYVIVFF